MKIEIAQTTVTGPTMIALKHGNRTMLWDTSAYAKSSDRRSPMNPENIFRDINAFWATLPAADQQLYWDLYVEAKEIFDSVFDIRDIQVKIQDVVRRMYDLPSLEKLHHWVVYKSGIKIPPTLKETWEQVNADNISYPHRKEKTYLRGEYVDLVVMTVSLRLMVPIWAEFIKTTRRQIGGNSKELEAFRLLYFSRLHNSQSMQRLLGYVHQTTMSELGSEIHATAILNGMGVNEFVDWMLSLTVVRRLSMCAVSSEDDISNVITNVHQYVRLGVKGSHKKHSKKFGGKVTLRNRNEIGDDGHKKSAAEIYKVKQEVPDSVRVLMNVYMDDPFNVLYRTIGLTKRGHKEFVSAKPEGLDERLSLCMHWINQVPDFEIVQHHLTLTQWSLTHVMSPRGIPQLQHDSLKRAMAVAQTVLWEWGFYDLAALVTAQPFYIDDDMMLGGTETRGRIPKELMEDLNRMWPHMQQSKKVNYRQSNVAAKAIDLLADHMTATEWVLCCPPELVERVSRGEQTRRMSTPADIRSTLALLLIHVHKLLEEEQ